MNVIRKDYVHFQRLDKRDYLTDTVGRMID